MISKFNSNCSSCGRPLENQEKKRCPHCGAKFDSYIRKAGGILAGILAVVIFIITGGKGKGGA